jgi:hypothetical protein
MINLKNFFMITRNVYYIIDNLKIHKKIIYIQNLDYIFF